MHLPLNQAIENPMRPDSERTVHRKLCVVPTLRARTQGSVHTSCSVMYTYPARLQFNSPLPQYTWTLISKQFSEVSLSCCTLWDSFCLYRVISLFAQSAASYWHSQLSPADAMTESLVCSYLNVIHISSGRMLWQMRSLWWRIQTDMSWCKMFSWRMHEFRAPTVWA